MPMSSIDKDYVKKLSKLSRIEVSNSEAEKLSKDLESILDYVGQVSEVSDTESKNKIGEIHNVMREDEKPHDSGKYSEDLLKASPERDGNYFKVKKIL